MENISDLNKMRDPGCSKEMKSFLKYKIQNALASHPSIITYRHTEQHVGPPFICKIAAVHIIMDCASTEKQCTAFVRLRHKFPVDYK